jgi:hypothetical protein
MPFYNPESLPKKNEQKRKSPPTARFEPLPSFVVCCVLPPRPQKSSQMAVDGIPHTPSLSWILEGRGRETNPIGTSAMKSRRGG